MILNASQYESSIQYCKATYYCMQMNGTYLKKPQILWRGVIHLVRMHEGGRGVKQMRTNVYKGGGGLTHEVRTQRKHLSAVCRHPPIVPFAKDPSQAST